MEPEFTTEKTAEVTTVATVDETTASEMITEAEKERVIDKDKPIIALTFDDGPNTTTTNEVLDVLEKYDVIASFFLVGNNINDETAEVVRRAYDMGCEINNHSKTHSNMDQMSVEDIVSEVSFVNDKVFEITGEYPQFFRPPYIAVNDVMLENIDMPFIAGYGANDWDDKVTAERRSTAVLRQAADGAIILLHDAQGNSLTVEALDTIIPSLLEDGYQFVTMSELFESKGIDPQKNIIYSYVEQTTMYA